MNKETNLPPKVIYQNYPDTEDEINISELFDKVWFRRKFIYTFVFVMVCLVAGVLAATLLINPPEQRYSQIIQFNFSGAEKGVYPGGQKFSTNDLVSAKVLEEVYRANDLKSYQIGYGDFVSAISVNPFAENAGFIKARYQGLLNNKKLSRPEIESLEQEYLKAINVSQSRFVRLSYLSSSLKGLDPIVVQKILMDIPRVWSRLAIDELGVLNLKVVSTNFYQPQMVERFEYLQLLEYLQNSSKTLSSAVSLLVSDEIGGLVRNVETGMTGYDLQIKVNNLINFEIEPLFSTITHLGITKVKEKALIYLQNTIQNLLDKKLVAEKLANNFALIIEQYSGVATKNKVSPQEGAAGGFAQYDSSFLDKFTALIEQKNDKAYKQDLLNKRLGVLQEIEEIQGQIIKFKRAEERLKVSDEEVSEDLRKSVIEDVLIARKDFEILMAGFQKLLNIRNQQVLGDSNLLYRLTSDDVLVESDMVAKLKKIIMITFLVSIVALMLAVVISLFRRLPEHKHATADNTE